MSLKDIFDNPTVAAIAGAIFSGFNSVFVDRLGWKKNSEDREVLGLLRLIKKRKNFSDLEAVLNNKIADLKKLADGEYKISGLHEVMEDDRKEIDRLGFRDVLLKMTPLPNSSEGIDKYLSKKYRGEVFNSTESFVDRRGGSVKEIFVVSSFDHITDKLKKEMQFLEGEKILVRVLCRTEDYKFAMQDSDIVIFGTTKASVGDISSVDLTCVGANIYTDEEKINKYIEIFERHYLNAMSLKDIGELLDENA